MVLHPPSVSTRSFSYNAATRTFAAEESDLGCNFRLGRVYDDAADVGFTLVSHVTGREVVFAVHREDRAADGELRATYFKPADQRDPDYTVVLFND